MGLLLKSLRRIDYRPTAESSSGEELLSLAEVQSEPAVIDETMTEETPAAYTLQDDVPADLSETLEQLIDLAPEDPTLLDDETPTSADCSYDDSEEPLSMPELPSLESAFPIEPMAASEFERIADRIDSAPFEPRAIEPLPPLPDEPPSNASTLDRLNELHALIDAALSEFQSEPQISAVPISQSPIPEAPIWEKSIAEESIVAQSLHRESAMPPEVERVILTFPESETASPVEPEPIAASSDTVVSFPTSADARETIPLPSAFSAPALRIRDEYRELRDHLLARFSLDQPCTLLVIDAGRVVGDAAWLAPFAACLEQYLSETITPQLDGPPKILLIEAGGPESGIVRHLGIDCPCGLSDLLNGGADWSEAIQPTLHPQIELLACGNALFQADQTEQLTTLWNDLRRRYHVVLVAVGPWETGFNSAKGQAGLTAEAFLPLADGAILHVELDGTPQTVAKATRRELEQRGVRLLGCVVSGATAFGS